MKIQTISIGLGRTHSLPDYNNVKPSIHFTVQITDEDDPAAIVQELTAECNHYIQREIDAAREAQGLPSIYNYTEPRVTITYWKDMGIVFLMPYYARSFSDKYGPGTWPNVTICLDPLCEYRVSSDNQRYTYAKQQATTYAEKNGYEFLDWHAVPQDEIAAKSWDLLRGRNAYARITMHLIKDHPSNRWARNIFDKKYTYLIPVDIAREIEREPWFFADQRVSKPTYFASRTLADQDTLANVEQYSGYLTINTLDQLAEAIAAAVAERDAAEPPPEEPEETVDEEWADEDDEEEEWIGDEDYPESDDDFDEDA